MSELSQAAVCQEAVDRIQNSKYFRLVVFGASNTERYLPGVHWSDILEVGIRSAFGRRFHLINSGISGNNTPDALGRFDRDVASFKPDIVVITLGGNDCNPKPGRFVSEADFGKNMDQIIRQIRDLGALPILQTYYKMDLEAMDPERAKNFVRYMELVREAAVRNDVFLVDQYKYFSAVDPLVLRYKLLLNPMHTNDLGNALIGVVLLRHFGIDPAIIDHNENLCAAMELYKKITA